MKTPEEKYLQWWAAEHKKKQDGEICFQGIKLLVKRDIFSPEACLTHSPTFMAKFLVKLEGKRVLDIGTGCGVLAIVAAKRGAKSVLAVDIDPVAVENAKLNIKKHQFGGCIKVIRSNLFENVPGAFDVIISNLPIAFSSPVWKDIKAEFTDIIPRWVSQVKKYLAPGGRAYLGWASFGDQILVPQAFESAGLKWDKFQESAFGVKWQVYKIRRG
jgi:16S rRNA G1207 methylase RsmC